MESNTFFLKVYNFNVGASRWLGSGWHGMLGMSVVWVVRNFRNGFGLGDAGIGDARNWCGPIGVGF